MTQTRTTPTRSLEQDRSVLDRCWKLHPSVSIRPEPFGALIYHFGTRRLSFLKSRLLLDVVTGLDDQPDARSACLAAGVPDAELATYGQALDTLASSQMIVPRDTDVDS